MCSHNEKSLEEEVCLLKQYEWQNVTITFKLKLRWTKFSDVDIYQIVDEGTE